MDIIQAVKAWKFGRITDQELDEIANDVLNGIAVR